MVHTIQSGKRGSPFYNVWRIIRKFPFGNQRVKLKFGLDSGPLKINYNQLSPQRYKKKMYLQFAQVSPELQNVHHLCLGHFGRGQSKCYTTMQGSHSWLLKYCIFHLEGEFQCPKNFYCDTKIGSLIGEPSWPLQTNKKAKLCPKLHCICT